MKNIMRIEISINHSGISAEGGRVPVPEFHFPGHCMKLKEFIKANGSGLHPACMEWSRRSDI